MDYLRIYAEFIKDRRAREPDLTGYTERHHILPRCMGGTDDPANLIRLTPEDHFFAHLLLAKAHGGKLWAPVAFMLGGSRKHYKPVASRARYGWAAREMAKAASGEGAHQYDWTIYRLEHRDGRKWAGTQAAMADDLGMTRPLANLLVKRKVGSALGWFHEGARPRFRGADLAGAAHPMFRPERHAFLHVDGRRFVGTQHDLHVIHGVPKPAACNLARGKFRCARGWYVEGRPPAKVGRGARWKIQAEANAG